MRSSAAVGAATRLSGLALFAALVCHTPAGLAQPRDPGGGSTVVLRGRVMAADEPAMPLRGARVTVIVSGSGSPAATSDDEGWFDVRVPARGGWSIRVSKAGYATAERAAPEPPSGSIAIALTPGAAVTGRVLDTRGVPVAGESVRVRCLGSCPAGVDPAPGVAAPMFTETDDRGVYRVGSLPSGQYEVALASLLAPSVTPAAVVPARDTAVPAGGARATRETALPGTALVRVDAGEEAVQHLVRLDDTGRSGSAAETRGIRLPLPLVRGQITAATGQPVAGASVQLRSTSDDTIVRGATSDADGRYEIYGLSPGTYRLTVTRTGFAPVQYGQQRALQQGTPISLQAGQALERLDVRLPPAGVIAGRVVDAHGEPLEMMTVRAWQRSFSDGRVVLTPATNVRPGRTDDRGGYRLYGLLPGVYHVSAHDELPSPSAPAYVATSDSSVGFAFESGAISFIAGPGSSDAVTLASGRPPAVGVFAPASTVVGDAAPIRIEPGLEHHGVDITFVPAAGARVLGAAVDAAGQPARGVATLRGSHRSGVPAVPERTAILDASGTFEFTSVPPGDYVVQVRTAGSGMPSLDLAGMMARAGLTPSEVEFVNRMADVQNVLRATQAGDSEFGVAFVTVTGAADVGVSVDTTPGSRVVGRLVVEGDRSAVSTASFGIDIVPADPDRAHHVVRGGSSAMEFIGVTGPVRFDLRRAPPGWYLKSAMVDGIDAAEHPVAFGLAADDREVEVVVAQGARVSGRVTDERGEAVRDYSVVVFPTDASRWYYRSRGLTLVRSDGSGGFIVDGLPPGDYFVAAADGIPGDRFDGEWQTADVLGRLASGARRVRVQGREQTTMTLRLMRMP